MTFAIFPLRVYYVSLFLLLVAVCITSINRAEHYDEAWFAEQAYWLIRDGWVRSELFRGFNGWEAGLYVFHKLFIYTGALIMSVVGVSVITSKLVSLLFGLGCGYLIWLYGKNTPREQRWLAVLLYFGCGTLIRYLAVNRPETMCMALGFASWLALNLPGPSSRPKPVLAGFLAGLAALTHLNGLIYCLAGVIWLLLKMGWRLSFLFAIASGVTLSLYGLDALLDGKLELLVAQFLNDPATQENLHLTDKLAVLADYHQIFFHSQNEAALTILVLLSAIAFRKHIRLSQPALLYTILLVVSFWLLTKSNTDIYFLLFVPWLAILAAQWAIDNLPVQPMWQQKTARVLLALYGLVSVSQFVSVSRENRDAVDVELHNSLLASHMPQKHTNIIAPIEFFFGQMDNYRIQGLTYYHLRERERGKIPLETFFQQARQNNVAYIISDHRLNASYEIPANAPSRIGVYQRIFQDSLNTIYARQ